MGPVLVTVREAAEMLRISRSHFYEEFITSGRVRVVHIGRSARIVVSDLAELVEALASDEGSAP